MATTLILGASRGLGAALVEGLPRRGDTVFGLSRGKPDWLRQGAAVKRHWIEADLSELSAVQNARAVLGRTPIDALIHVAGIWDPETFDHIHDDEIAEVLDIDLRSFLAFARGLAPNLRRAGSAKIVAIGSTSGLENGDGSSVAYTAAKFGLRGACHALRQHFRKDGIAVTCLSPGSIAGEVGWSSGAAAALKRHRGRRMPVGDIVAMIRCILDLSPAACVKEIAMPALKDEDV
jgi:short-subunit dehydrogenase